MVVRCRMLLGRPRISELAKFKVRIGSIILCIPACLDKTVFNIRTMHRICGDEYPYIGGELVERTQMSGCNSDDQAGKAQGSKCRTTEPMSEAKQ